MPFPIIIFIINLKMGWGMTFYNLMSETKINDVIPLQHLLKIVRDGE